MKLHDTDKFGSIHLANTPNGIIKIENSRLRKLSLLVLGNCAAMTKISEEDYFIFITIHFPFT